MPNFTTSDGCPIDYTLYDARHANAPRLALIHSLALDRSIWDGAVGDLGCDMHVVAYDCRGHGRSGKPSGPYSVEQFARISRNFSIISAGLRRPSPDAPWGEWSRRRSAACIRGARRRLV